MNEDRFRHGLHVLTEDVTPSDEALHRLIGKQRSREIRRRIAGGTSALAVITALAVVAIQIRPGAPDQPPFGSGSPSPGTGVANAEQIAYIDQGDLFLKDLDGPTRRITEDGHDRSEFLPFIRGSQQILWVSLDPEDSSTLWELDLATDERRALLETPGRIQAYDIASDGTFAVLTAENERQRVSLVRSTEPAFVEASSPTARWSLAQEIVDFPAYLGHGVGIDDDVHVSWSPDGKQLLIVNTFIVDEADETLLVVDRAGTVTTEIRRATHGRWIDADRILFRAFDEPTWTIRTTKTGDERALPGVPASATQPVVSPNGTRVAMHVEEPGRPWLYVADLTDGAALLKDRIDGALAVWLDDATIGASTVAACPEDCVEGWRTAGGGLTIALATGATDVLDVTSTREAYVRYSITFGGAA